MKFFEFDFFPRQPVLVFEPHWRRNQQEYPPLEEHLYPLEECFQPLEEMFLDMAENQRHRLPIRHPRCQQRPKYIPYGRDCERSKCSRNQKNGVKKPSTAVCDRKREDQRLKTRGVSRKPEQKLFHESFSMRDFNPENIDVKVEKGLVRFLARKEEKSHDGYSMKEVSRIVSLPRDADMESVNVWLDRQGIMHVSAEVIPQESKALEDRETASKAEQDIQMTNDSSKIETQPLEPDQSSVDEDSLRKETNGSGEEIMVLDDQIEDTSSTREPIDERSKEKTEEKRTSTDDTEPDIEVVNDESKEPQAKEDSVCDEKIQSSQSENEPAAESHEIQTYEQKPFEVSMDVSGYNPGNLSVRVSGHRVIVSSEDHAEGPDGSISHRQFTRYFTLPETIDTDSLRSSLSSKGKLTISAMSPPAKPVDRMITVEMEK